MVKREWNRYIGRHAENVSEERGIQGQYRIGHSSHQRPTTSAQKFMLWIWNVCTLSPYSNTYLGVELRFLLVSNVRNVSYRCIERTRSGNSVIRMLGSRGTRCRCFASHYFENPSTFGYRLTFNTIDSDVIFLRCRVFPNYIDHKIFASINPDRQDISCDVARPGETGSSALQRHGLPLNMVEALDHFLNGGNCRR